MADCGDNYQTTETRDRCHYDQADLATVTATFNFRQGASLVSRIIAIIFSVATMFVMAAAGAQDYTGNVNPSAWVGPTVMHSAINAQARRNGARSSANRRQVETCSMKSGFRARHGANDPQVRELYRRCRLMGL